MALPFTLFSEGAKKDAKTRVALGRAASRGTSADPQPREKGVREKEKREGERSEKQGT